MNTAGAFTYGDLGVTSLHEQEHNGFADELVTLGFDMRVQWARLGAPSYDANNQVTYPELSAIPMQLQPYLTIKPHHSVTLYGSFMPGPDLFNRDGGAWEPDKQVYRGMSAYEGWARYSTQDASFSARAGLMQPTFGIRHDDHTILIRGDARDRRTPLIPPNFVELGAELSYQPTRWFRADLGVFDNSNLNASLNHAGVPPLSADATGDPNELGAVAANARVMLMPQFTFGGPKASEGDGFDDFDDFGEDVGDDVEENNAPQAPKLPLVVHTWLGGSAYASGDFMMLNGFVGLGTDTGWALIAEAMWSKRTIFYRQLNTHVNLSYDVQSWLVLNARVERAQTHSATNLLDEVAVTWQTVAGARLFVLPYVEVRPEYRLVDNLDYRFGQATVQLHMFY
jgi:hypothetical protein